MTKLNHPSDQGFAIGPWEARPASGELIGRTETRRLEPKVMLLLCLLAERAPEVVGREAILDALWPDTVVGEDALARCLLKLRRALDDDAKNPEYIETLPRRGYRLLVPVEGPSGNEPPAGSPNPRKSPASAVLWALAAATFAVLLVGPTLWPDAELETPLLSRAHDHYYQFERAENERAHLLYQRVLETRPNDAEALAGLANTLSQRVIRWPDVGGPVPAPERRLGAALNSGRLESPWAQATLERARELTERAVDIDPQSGFAWKAHGLVAALRRDLDAARQSYARALDVDPSSWESAVNLGDLDLIENNQADAIRHFVRAYGIMEGRYPESAQRIGPWQPEVGVLIGELYRELGDNTRAEAWFRRVLSSTPLHVDATLALAASRAKTGDEQEAESLCRDLVSRIGPLDDCAPYLPER